MLGLGDVHVAPPPPPIPFFDLTLQHRAIADEVNAAIARVVESQHFILGPEVVAFESAMASRLQVPHAIGVSSGTDALVVALLSLGVGPGDEVVTSPFTFVATASAIVRTGATPVFVDIDPKTFAIDPAAVERAVSPRTRVVLAVHLFGQMADVSALREACHRHGLALVEDAAQAIFAARDGFLSGAAGSVGCFSFFPSKNLGAYGDGGMIVTSDPGIAERARALRAHGQRKKYVAELAGGNFRLDALQAAVLSVKLRHIDRLMNRRAANAERYQALFAEAGFGSEAASVGEDAPIVLPFVAPRTRHVWNQFVVRARDRDALRAHLTARAIGTEVYYPVPLHEQPAFRRAFEAQRGDGRTAALPHAERACREVLALPVFPELEEAQLERVVAEVAAFYQR